MPEYAGGFLLAGTTYPPKAADLLKEAGEHRTDLVLSVEHSPSAPPDPWWGANSVTQSTLNRQTLA